MSQSKTPLHRAINQWALPKGFNRRTANWRRINEDTIQVINLQKSNYGAQYYLNVGVWLRTVDRGQMTPQASRCHLSARIGSLCTVSREHLAAVFDLESGLSDQERTKSLTALLDDALDDETLRTTSSLDLLRSPAGRNLMRSVQEPGAVKKFSVLRDGREPLGLPIA